ncbi:MAG: carbohydrate kinase family protein, partial [Gammaproteobacteria bacterium]
STHEELIAFPLGSKLLIKELKTTTGGGGTNTAVAFSKLGLKTAFLGKLGDDASAEFVLDSLHRENVEFIGAQGGQTGLSVILNSIKDDRSILAYKGANDNLYPEDIPEFEADWVYLSSMLNGSFDTVCQLLRKPHTFKLAFNPSNYQAKLGYQALKDVIDNATLLVMNREEACKLLGLSYIQLPAIEELVAQLAKLPPQYFVITDGARGAWVYDRKHLYHGKPHPNLTIVETTGAGDAFAATFTAALQMGLGTREALDLAMTNSESVLSEKGAKGGLLTRPELQARVEASPRQIETLASGALLG